MADVEAVMRKYDRESNTRIWSGKPKIVIDVIMAAFSVYCVISTLCSTAALEIRLTAFVGLIILLGYLTYPASKKHVRDNYLPWYDVVIMLLGAGAFFYYCFTYKDFVVAITSSAKMTLPYTVTGIIGILVVAELCRRCVGMPILVVAGTLVAYAFSTGISIPRFIYSLFYTTSGILSTPINVCAKFIVVFIIFGAFLERTGIANFFISLANSVAGAASGGPAKVAVIASALEGMASGSSVANTVGSGSITIPMMKKTGYRPEFAAAVEAAASTGGQIMPPIMGAAAFLMAEYMGVTYGEVALRAILPAMLYFLGIFIAVHLEARRRGLRGIPRRELPKMGELVKKVYLLAPIVVLVVLVSLNLRSIQVSASIAIIVAIIASLFDRDARITPKKFLDALAGGGRGTITVAVACAVAGVIAGCITVTGLASQLIGTVIQLSGGIPMVGLLLTMICCIILGMGVPTTANYCIMAATCAPILVRLGINPIAAHFFVFYFGIVADITPPVALAAYAGAAIAKSNPMKTGFVATKLAIAAFIVPYIFALSPSMLFINTTAFEVTLICVTAVLGIFGVAVAVNGFIFRSLKWYARVLFAAAGLSLLIPGLVTDVVGLVILGGLTVAEYLLHRRETAAVVS
ncbi:MAG: TRAP transporter fused permease subunit [Clostridiaceae bacterium]|nr:TRAP transporter fused permease subunit [Clostridiaceae bacterium]